MRATVAIIGLLLLGGCAADTKLPDTPTMYVNMASPGATLDPVAAASMISLYRQNNGLGTVIVDPGLMKLAEEQSQAMAARNKMDHDRQGSAGKAAGRVRLSCDAGGRKRVGRISHPGGSVSGWRDSPRTKANMLKNGVTKLGIAASYAPNTKYKVFWTLILAST